MQVKKQELKLDMEHWTVSKLGKEYDKAAYCHSAYLPAAWSETVRRLISAYSPLDQRLLSGVISTCKPLDKHL